MGALRTGPYGRCVYRCVNDVVDNQVVNLLFENGSTARFTMTVFTKSGCRETRIFGTRGQLTGNSPTIEVYDFPTDQATIADTPPATGTVTGGHGGGDFGLMKAFQDVVGNEDLPLVLTGAWETLETHLVVFAAETSRRESRVVNL